MTGSSINHQCTILKQLRRSERIFDLIRENTEPELRFQNRLRQEFPAEVVRAALTLQELRLRAVSKFSRASAMWFDRKGLEQSTSEPVARQKAGRFHGRVWDYCSGIGGDAIALAERCEVIAVDRCPAACLCCSWNAEVYSVASRLRPVCADVKTLTDRTGLLHIDPDRRVGSQGRVVRVQNCVPGTEFLQQLTREFAGGAIKLSPAANFAGKFAGAEYELVSLAGECKEATVWFGELAGQAQWRATVLPTGQTITGDPLEAVADFGPLDRYLYDPDPALVRAGLVDRAAEMLGLERLDHAEEYLTADVLLDSPFVRPFEVLAELPNKMREIRRYFRRSDFGRVEIKCRHIPIQAEAVRRKLPLPGDQPAVLVFARIAGRAHAVVCRRVGSNKNR